MTSLSNLPTVSEVCHSLNFTSMTTSPSLLSMQSSSNGNMEMPDYVRMLLLSDDRKAVLMLYEDGQWELPYFVYDSNFPNLCVHRCCRDLATLLSVSSSIRHPFSVIAELYGEFLSYGRSDDGELGFAKLLLMENHTTNFDLPQMASWKTAQFLSSLLEGQNLTDDCRACFEDIFYYLTHPEAFETSLTDQRYQFGWYDRALSWFNKVIFTEGHEGNLRNVVQHQVVATSTVIRLDAEEGSFYLKAPAVGLKEVSITRKIAQLFPALSPEIVDVSPELNSFVSASFFKMRIDESQYREMVFTLATVQLGSINVLGELESSGCEVRTPRQMVMKLEEWKDDMQVREVLGDLYSKYVVFVPRISQLLNRLDSFNLPLTVVHGDFSDGNIAFRSEEADQMILYDWQYACISNPFLDLHEVTVHNDFPEDIINDYLDLWLRYETKERLWEAFQLARSLGWILKMWTSIECLKQCNAQKFSSFDDIVTDAFKVMTDKIESYVASNTDPP